MSFRRWLARLLRIIRTRSRSRRSSLVLMMERRRFPRVRSHNLIRVFRRSPPEFDRLFNLADLSEGGFKIWTGLDPGCGTLLEAILNLREQEMRLLLRLRVAWRRPPRYPLSGQMGVESLDLPEESRRALRQLVLKKLFCRRAA